VGLGATPSTEKRPLTKTSQKEGPDKKRHPCGRKKKKVSNSWSKGPVDLNGLLWETERMECQSKKEKGKGIGTKLVKKN